LETFPIITSENYAGSLTLLSANKRTPALGQSVNQIYHCTFPAKSIMSWVKEDPYKYSWWESLCIKLLRCGEVPKHVAFIMDGNRRYAKKLGLDKIDGHSQGFEKLAQTLQWCHDLGITEVTVYAFSIENFKRPQKEVDGLLKLAKEKFERLIDEKDRLEEHGIRVNVIGNLSLLPTDLQILVDRATALTRQNTRCTLNVAFSYTSREEVCSAVKKVSKAVDDGILKTDDISENLIERCLYTGFSPRPELLVRTSGEVRLSDFLLWQSSYSVTYFSEVLWPEFGLNNLLFAIFYFQRHHRYVQHQPLSENLEQNERIHEFLKSMQIH